MEAQPAPEPRLIARTERWLVVDKPPGWLVIPGRGHERTPVLLEWARALEPAAQVVHRIDLETSGVTLFARGAEAHREANGWFAAHRVTKLYDSLAAGRALVPMLRVREAIEGAPAVSQVEVKESYVRAFLARVRPHTGRRHQIRIHLANRGHPLLGDPAYGGPRELATVSGPLVIPRVALHARRLELPGGEAFEADWPRDFATWVAALRDESAAGAASAGGGSAHA